MVLIAVHESFNKGDGLEKKKEEDFRREKEKNQEESVSVLSLFGGIGADYVIRRRRIGEICWERSGSLSGSLYRTVSATVPSSLLFSGTMSLKDGCKLLQE